MVVDLSKKKKERKWVRPDWMPKSRLGYLGYPYDEAIKRSLCFKCSVSDSCETTDTDRKKGLMFRPTVICTGFKE